MICPAVRVENALPFEDRYAPVIAFAIAASGAAIVPGAMPSRPPRELKGLTIETVSGAPVMWYDASTLPTRSTTTMCAGLPRACASAAAWATMRSTSAVVRATGSDAGDGPALPSPAPPQAASSEATSSAAYLSRILRFRNECRIPRAALVVEPVAQQAVRHQLRLDRLRARVALPALVDLRQRDVGDALRPGDVVAIDALRARVRLVVEARVGHPQRRDLHRRDLETLHVVALLARTLL